MAGYNPYYPAAGPAPAGFAFPVLPPHGYGAVKQRSNAATHSMYLAPGSATPENIRGMEYAANTYTGLPAGTAKARQGLRGNIYIEAQHRAVPEWGGDEPVMTYFAGHVPPPGGVAFAAPAPAISRFHVKTKNATGQEQHYASAIPSVPRGGPPSFTQFATPVAHIEKAYLAPSSGNVSSTVATGLARAFGNYARLHPPAAAPAAAGAPQWGGPAPAAAPQWGGPAPMGAPFGWPGRRGGRKSRKSMKKRRKARSRKH